MLSDRISVLPPGVSHRYIRTDERPANSYGIEALTWTYTETEVVNYRDRYNWDANAGKSTGFGPITISDEQMNSLREAGLAQNFNMTGQSSPRTSSG